MRLTQPRCSVPRLQTWLALTPLEAHPLETQVKHKCSGNKHSAPRYRQESHEGARGSSYARRPTLVGDLGEYAAVPSTTGPRGPRMRCAKGQAEGSIKGRANEPTAEAWNKAPHDSEYDGCLGPSYCRRGTRRTMRKLALHPLRATVGLRASRAALRTHEAGGATRTGPEKNADAPLPDMRPEQTRLHPHIQAKSHLGRPRMRTTIPVSPSTDLVASWLHRGPIASPNPRSTPNGVCEDKWHDPPSL